ERGQISTPNDFASRPFDICLRRGRIVKIATSLVTASKWRVCREGHTSGPCPSLFSAARTQIGFVGGTLSAPDDHERNCAARFPSRSRLLLRRQMRGAPRPSARPAFLQLPPLERLDVAAKRL